MKNRALLAHLRQRAESDFGRLIVLTGARQTGKTTLALHAFPEYEYISLDDPVTRPDFASLSAADWRRRFPRAILDEVQKLPALFDSVKAVYDSDPGTRYLLLGSSQILLLDKVRESLAGRVSLVELFPLTLPEMLTDSWDEPIVESKMVRWMKSPMADMAIFDGMPTRDDRFAHATRLLEDYLQFGAMPAIADSSLAQEDRREWLRNYIRTYLQRDVRDLANLRELEPFVQAQRALAGLTGQVLNSSGLARVSGVSASTARRFVSYLEISYQILLLRPWFRNTSKRLSKAPKVHFLDPGVQRALLARRGDVGGHEFESAVVAEIYKQLRSCRLDVELYHLRTVDGREIDLLLETEKGFVPIEIKSADRVSAVDARHLRDISQILDKPVLHSLLLSNDPRVRELESGITALPVGWFLT